MALPRGRFRDTADLLRFLETTRNDLEAPARALQPVIGEVLAAIAALPGALLARMSGSGATCFGIFADDDGCARAAEILKKAAPGWWVAPTFVPETGIVHEAVGQDIGPTDQAGFKAKLTLTANPVRQSRRIRHGQGTRPQAPVISSSTIRRRRNFMPRARRASLSPTAPSPSRWNPSAPTMPKSPVRCSAWWWAG